MQLYDRDPRNPSRGGSDFTPIRPGSQLPPFAQKKGSNTLFTDPPMGPNIDRRGVHRNRVRLSKRERLERARATHGLHDSPEVIHARAVLDANSALSKQDEQRILIQMEEEKQEAAVQEVRRRMGQGAVEAHQTAEARRIAATQRAIEHAGGDPSAMEAYGFRGPAEGSQGSGLRQPMARPGQSQSYQLPPSGVADDTQNPEYGGQPQALQHRPVGAPTMDESQLSPEQLAEAVGLQAAQEAQATQAGMNPGLNHAQMMEKQVGMNPSAQYELEELQQRMAAQEAELNMLRAMQPPVAPQAPQLDPNTLIGPGPQEALSAPTEEEMAELSQAVEASLSAEGIIEGLGTPGAPEGPEGSEVSLEILEEAETLSTEELEAFDAGASRDPEEPKVVGDPEAD